MNEKVKYWVEISEYDFETAKAMLESKRLLYVGFMCHQTIEKILKAYYVASIKDLPPYTHNLRYLAEKALLYKKFSEEQKEIIDLLQPLNIEARYPTYKDKLFKSLSFDRCTNILKETGELLIWIQKELLK